jgi:galactose mutarotase-like enzyme
MNFRATRQDGKTLDEIESGGLRVRIDRHGAEMVSLALNGVGFLYRDGDVSQPVSGWANHATVMGYFLHRLWNEQSVYRGSTIRGGNHGFLRHFDFAEPALLADGIAYRVRADQIPPDAYPLRVSLALSYRLTGSGVRVDFEFTNEEPARDAHVSFGLHPGFAVGSVREARVILPPGKYVRHMAPGNFLDGATEMQDFSGGEFPYPKSDLPGSFIIGMEGIKDRTFRIEDPQRGTAVALDFSEVPYVTFWSDSDNFLCIEPCWGLPDSNPPVAFENKAGIQVIPPGGSLNRGFSIQPSILT